MLSSLPLLPPSLFRPASAELPFPMVPLPYEAPSLPLSPFQLVELTPFPVKAREVVVADVAPATGVGLDPFCVVAGAWVLSAAAGPAVGWGSALCPCTAGGKFPEPWEEPPSPPAFPAALPPALPPPLVLAFVGVLPPTLAALVGVPSLSAGVAATPPPLLDPAPESGVAAEPGEAVGAVPGVVAGFAGAAAEDEVALFPLPLPLPLPFAIPFALPLLPFPFPLPFPLSLPLPLLARRPTVFATGPSSSGGGAALGTSLHVGLLSASTSSSSLSRALTLSSRSGGRRIFAARSRAVGNK